MLDDEDLSGADLHQEITLLLAATGLYPPRRVHHDTVANPDRRP
jgi:hypothetical protein